MKTTTRTGRTGRISASVLLATGLLGTKAGSASAMETEPARASEREPHAGQAHRSRLGERAERSGRSERGEYGQRAERAEHVQRGEYGQHAQGRDRRDRREVRWSGRRPDPAELAAAVAKRLGSRSAGPYVDRRGRPVVAVTSAEDAAIARAHGVRPRSVPRDGATLTRTRDEIRRTAALPGTSWSIDPTTAQVVVEADSTVRGARLAALRAAVRRHGGAARLERPAGRISLRVAGGDAILGGRYRCSLGFNVRRGRSRYLLTAGHCTQRAARWRLADDTVLGTRAGSRFPGDDYGIVRHTNRRVAKSGTVRLRGGRVRDITGPGTAVVGTTVWRSGSTTGLRRGRVTGVGTIVQYGRKQVSGMIRTTVCAEPGDSGGPLFRGRTALGITSGGTGDCRRGGVTYFQPVGEALRRYQVRLL